MGTAGAFGPSCESKRAVSRLLKVHEWRRIRASFTHEMVGFMSVRFNVVLSDDLNREIDKVAKDAETNKSEILRKALQLFLAAHEGKRQGLKIGLVEPKTDKLKTEIIGL